MMSSGPLPVSSITTAGLHTPSVIASTTPAICSPCSSPHGTSSTLPLLSSGGQSPHSIVGHKALEYDLLLSDAFVSTAPLTETLDEIDRLVGDHPFVIHSLLEVSKRYSQSAKDDLALSIERLISLRIEYISRYARPLLQRLVSHPRNANVFNAPVDAVALGLTTYHQRIHHPMDLGTVKAKLVQREYTTIHQVWEDIRLVFRNAIVFNGESHVVSLAAKELLKDFEHDLLSLREKITKELATVSLASEQQLQHHRHNCDACQGETCLLCGEGCLRVEGPVIQCSMPKCHVRIKKGFSYYVSRDGLLLWCAKCFAAQTPAVRRMALSRHRAEEDLAEKWTKQCNLCRERMHDICVLRIHEKSSKRSAEMNENDDKKKNQWTCPLCDLSMRLSLTHSLSHLFRSRQTARLSASEASLSIPMLSRQIHPGDKHSSLGLAKHDSNWFPLTRQISDDDMDLPSYDYGHRQSPVSPPLSSLLSAKQLPICSLSNFLECAIHVLCESRGYSHMKESFSVRVLSQTEQSLVLPFSIRANFDLASITTLPYTQKCIALFQTIAGVDTFLFSLYTQEYSSSCPAPNTNCVYVSYLDSLEFLRPCCLRTPIFQELLVCYLAWSRQRGFAKCMLWACPPQRGDSFIFWCKPTGQRTPSRDRLNAWYRAIALRCGALGLTDSSGADLTGKSAVNGNDPTEVPSKSKSTKIKERQFEAHFERFIGTGEDGDRKERKSRRVGSGDRSACTTRTILGEESSALAIESSSGSNDFQCPPCPPLFEGDFWLLEFIRLHRVALQRQRQSEILSCSLFFSEEERRMLAQSSASVINSTGGISSPAPASTPSAAAAAAAQLTARIAQANRRVRAILQSLFSRSQSSPFRKPVDVIALRIPHYREIIKQPMDLSTMRTKLRTGQYRHILSFAEDLRLIFANAMLFNPPGHPVHTAAQLLLSESERLLRDMFVLMTELSPAVLQQSQELIDEKYASIPLSLSFCLMNHDNSTSSNSHSKLQSQPESRSSVHVVMEEDSFTSRESESLSRSHSSPALDVSPFDSQSSVLTSIAPETQYAQQEVVVDDLMQVETEEAEDVDTIDDDDAGDNQNYMDESNELEGQGGLECGQSSVSSHDQSNSVDKYRLQPSALQSVLKDVAKAVQRVNDDLFLFVFAPLSSLEESHQTPTTSSGAQSLLRNEGKDDADCATPEDSAGSQSTALRRKRGRPNAKRQERERERAAATSVRVALAPELQTLLAALTPSSSVEPDPFISHPIVDSRHIFLECCQVMKAQFDTLRRAQYSTQRILHRLLACEDNKGQPPELPSCMRCGRELKQLRWSCCECQFHECKDCFETFDLEGNPYPTAAPASVSALGSDDNNDRSVCKGEAITSIVVSGTGVTCCQRKHAHQLTPFRVVPVP